MLQAGAWAGAWADDDADRYLDLEYLFKQHGKRKRRQRITTKVGKAGVCRQGHAGNAKCGLDRPAKGFQYRAVAAALAQCAHLVRLAFCDVAIQLFKPCSVAGFQSWSEVFSDARQQAVFHAEGFRFDQEVTRHFVGLE